MNKNIYTNSIIGNFPLNNILKLSAWTINTDQISTKQSRKEEFLLCMEYKIPNMTSYS